MTRNSLVSRVLVTGALLGLAHEAAAVSFELGDASVRIDSQFSTGFAVRMEDQSRTLIGQANTTADGDAGLAYSTNGDDGNLQFDNGDVFAAASKLTSDLSFNWGNFGAFVRGTYTYDWVLNDEDFLDPADHMGPTDDTLTPADLVARRDKIQDTVGNDADLLDAYVYGDFDIAGRYLAVRVGQQVLNWGESTFVQNGINSLLAADANHLRVPGFQLEEVFRPVGMAWASTDIADNVSLDVFYQYEWRPTIIEAAGTYFSTNDFAGPGGQTAQIGFGRAPENAYPLTPCSDGTPCVPFGAAINRLPDRDAKDDDQFGGALRMYIPVLNDLDLSFYAANYHSRLPIVSGQSRPTGNSPSTESGYRLVYPENIKLYGLSFNTTVWGGIALQAEYSRKEDQPLQIDDVELLLAGLGVSSQVAPIQGSALGGQEIVGYRRFNVNQVNVGLTKIFGPWGWIGSDQATMVLETAAMNVEDMPELEELRLEAPGTYTPGDATTAAALGVPQQIGGYPTASSRGYRVATRLTYNNVFNRFVMEPAILWQHDVNGTSPTPLTNFVEGRQQINLVLNTRYLDRLEYEVGYTIFQGAKPYNLLGDRDFLHMVVKYSF
ncbi:DUF1302 domain-containing protein [uncultured Abyssibacter sp.]|uniref:DUF1302 domain-containing protein n=1 Tax=uncultured Abyssibacter sp. TaxID=2320202 RepID=UPI0032B2413E